MTQCPDLIDLGLIAGLVREDFARFEREPSEKTKLRMQQRARQWFDLYGEVERDCGLAANPPSVLGMEFPMASFWEARKEAAKVERLAEKPTPDFNADTLQIFYDLSDYIRPLLKELSIQCGCKCEGKEIASYERALGGAVETHSIITAIDEKQRLGSAITLEAVEKLEKLYKQGNMMSLFSHLAKLGIKPPKVSGIIAGEEWHQEMKGLLAYLKKIAKEE